MFEHTINLNYEWYPGIDLTFDITRRLPIASHRLAGVYSEHVIEHLPYSSVPYVLGECRRVLRPGGTLRLLVPDAELYLDTYCRIRRGEEILFPYHQSEPDATPMMHVNRVFKSYGHLYAYDFETLGRMLANAGFIEIMRCQHRCGRDNNLLLDSDEREVESLRLEATAP